MQFISTSLLDIINSSLENEHEMHRSRKGYSSTALKTSVMAAPATATTVPVAVTKTPVIPSTHQVTIQIKM